MLTAFSVVLGTLLIHGLTLKGLLRVLNLQGGDPVGDETRLARERMLEVVLSELPAGASTASDLVRKNFKLRLGGAVPTERAPEAFGAIYNAAYGAALQAARTKLLAMRKDGDIGDDAFHNLENQLDWMEVSDPLRAANADEA